MPLLTVRLLNRDIGLGNITEFLNLLIQIFLKKLLTVALGIGKLVEWKNMLILTLVATAILLWFVIASGCR